MALTVGELVGYLRLDGQQFDRQIDQSGRRFEGLGRTVATGTRTMAQVLVGATTATVGLGVAAVRVGLDYNRMQQSSRAALTTLLGSAEAANAQMDKLDEFAKTSPFAKQVFITAQQQLLGFGVQAEKVLPILDAIQQAVAAVGGSNDDIAELTRIIAQVQSSGKITAETLNQLGARGVDAATLIGSQMGKTGAQIREDITKGSLDAGKAIDALTAGMMARFDGATDNIKQQMDGAADRVKGAFRDIGSVIARPFIDPNGGGYLVTWTNRVADALRNAEQKAKPLVDLLVSRYRPALESVDGLLERVGRTVNAWDLSKVNGQLDTLTGYAPLIAGTSAALFALGTRNLPVLSSLGLGGLNPVVAGVAALVAASPALRQAGGDFLRALEPLVPVARELGGAAVNAAMAVLDELAPALRDLLLAAAPVIVQLGSALGPALAAVLGVAEPVAAVLADVVAVLAQVPTPVIVAATAFWALNAAVDAAGKGIGALPGLLTKVRTGATLAGTALRTAFGPIGLIIGAVASGFALFAHHNEQARQRAEDFRETLDQATAAVTENTRALAYNNLEQAGYIDIAKRAGANLRDLVDAAIDPASAAAQRLRDSADRAREALEREVAENGFTPRAAEMRDRLAELETVLGGVGLQQDAVAESQARARDEIAAGIGVTDSATGAVQGHTDALQANADAQREAAGNAVSLREAQLRLGDAQDRVNQAVKDGTVVTRDATGAVDLNAESTRAADEALLGLWRQQDTVTEAMRRNNAAAVDLNSTIRQQRDDFIAAATQMGYTADEAAALADQYGLIPRRVITEVIAETQQAEGATRRVIQNLNTITGRTWRTIVEVSATGQVTSVYDPRSGLTAKADGGLHDGGRGWKRFADGGVNGAGQRVARVPQVVAGGANILWGEPETGWEAYISGKPSQRMRNLAVLEEAANRLGRITVPAGTLGHADGVMRGSGPVAVTVPADGWQITGALDIGGALVPLVDARISRAQSARTSSVRQGVRS